MVRRERKKVGERERERGRKKEKDKEIGTEIKSRFTLAEASQAPETNVLWSGERERDITSPV